MVCYQDVSKSSIVEVFLSPLLLLGGHSFLLHHMQIWMVLQITIEQFQ